MRLLQITYANLLTPTPISAYNLDQESEGPFDEFNKIYQQSVDWARILTHHNAYPDFLKQHKLPNPLTKEWFYQAQDVAFEDKYIKHLKANDVHVFVLVWYQIPGFEARMKRYGLDKYIKFRSKMATNHNYPTREIVNCLQVIIMDYKEYAN